MKDSKSALKIKQLISVFLIIMTLGTYIGLFRTNEREMQISKFETKKEVEKLEEEKQTIEVAQETSYEREIKVTSRSEAQREKIVEEAPETKYISIEEIKISKDMDLSIRCGISREDFIKLMENMKVDYSGFFAKNAGIIYDLCEKYEINEIFFCGLIAAESGWNIASSHRNAHNYISMMSSKGLIRYSSEEEGLEAATKLLHNKYLTPGGSCYSGKTLSAVQKRFCPNSSTWVGLVFGCMKQVVK